MAEKRSVYLSSKALAMPRRMDSLSGRINQALERYAWILARDGPRIRAMFDASQWADICDAARDWRELSSDEVPGAVLRALQSIRAPCSASELRDADLVLLADIAEGDM